MSTSLIEGKSYAEAVAAVVEAAERALQPGDRIGFWSEKGKEKVLVGIAQPGKASFAIEVDRSEFNGMTLLQLMEVDMTPTKDPHAAARRAMRKTGN